jgi:hypothetical protein
MLHLEYRPDQEALRVAVVSTNGQDFADNMAARLPLDMDDEINRFSDLRFGIGVGGPCVAKHDQIGERRRGFLRRIGVDGRQRTHMAGVKESTDVRASIPRTSPRVILSGLKRSVSFNNPSKDTLVLKVQVWDPTATSFDFRI